MKKFRQIIPPGFGHTSKVYKILDQYFILIPKNASNTILFGTGLSADAIDFSDLDPNIVLNTFIKEPVERFKASIIESIKRCSLFNSGDMIANFSSVPVSKDIEHLYHHVFEKINNDPFKFIYNILELISYNFYDPHLCPQWFFFTDIKRKPLTKIRVHNLERIDTVMKEFNMPIKNSYNVRNSFDLEKYQKRKIKKYTQFIKNSFSKIDNNLLDFYHSFKFFRHSSIRQSEVVFNFLDYEDWLIISNKIRNTIDNNQELKNLIYSIYEHDSQLYLNSKKNKEFFLYEDFKF